MDAKAAIDLIFTILDLAILGRILLSWIDPSPFADNPLKRVLWALTEPLLAPLRRYVPPMGMFDITPVVAILLLQLLRSLTLALFGLA